MDFPQWWLTADFAQQATVIGAGAAVIALIVSLFAKARKNKVTAKKGSIAIGGSAKGNTFNAPSDKS